MKSHVTIHMYISRKTGYIFIYNSFMYCVWLTNSASIRLHGI